MAYGTAMRELRKYLSPCRVDGFRDLLPGGNLLVRVDTWYVHSADCHSTDVDASRDDETGRGALNVVLRFDRGRDAMCTACASHGRHHNSVRKKKRSQLKR